MKDFKKQFTDCSNKRSGESVMDISFSKHKNSCSLESSKLTASVHPSGINDHLKPSWHGREMPMAWAGRRVESNPSSSHTHTRLSQNHIFRNKNHHDLKHSIIFRNASANTSPHLWNKSGRQTLREDHREIYIVHLPYQFRAAENAICWSSLTVHQSNHFTTILRTSDFTQVSLFLSMVTKGHFSWYAFLNLWKCLLFTGDGFAGALSIDSAMFSLVYETFFTNGALIPKIYLACSFMGMFS